MIDFHCHLDLYEDPKSVLKGAIDRKCYVLAVTTTPLAWKGNCELFGNIPRVRIAPGLHPELAASRSSEVDKLCDLIPESRYVGEIGLDGSKLHRDSISTQQQVFSAILRACGEFGGRILSIHSRGAATLVLDQLEKHDDAGTAVMHWFSGSKSELERAVELGCWFSVGPIMLSTSRGQRIIRSIPRNRVLTETDGPFAHLDSEPLMPWDVTQAESILSKVWKMPVIEVRKQMLRNLAEISRSSSA